MPIRPGALRRAAAQISRQKLAFAGGAGWRAMLANPNVRAALTGAATGGITSLFEKGEPDEGFGSGLWRFARNAAIGAGVGYGGSKLMGLGGRGSVPGKVTVLPKELPAAPNRPALGPRTISIPPSGGGVSPSPAPPRVIVTPPPVSPDSIRLPNQPADNPSFAYRQLGRRLMRQTGRLSTDGVTLNNLRAFGPINENFRGIVPPPPVAAPVTASPSVPRPTAGASSMGPIPSSPWTQGAEPAFRADPRFTMNYRLGPNGTMAPADPVGAQARLGRRVRAKGRYDYDPRRRSRD